MSATARGTLWLVPNALDLGVAGEAMPLDRVLGRDVVERAASLTHWAVEHAKSARAFLKRVQACMPLAAPLPAIDIRELPRAPKDGRDAPPTAAWEALLAPLHSGHDLGLLSEAGLPAVADPGSALVAMAHAAGLRVVPLAGPSSITLALAASGLHGQSFAFVGYLPTDAAERAARVRALEAHSRRERQTQIAIETPYRNAALMQGLLAALQPTTRLAVACGVTVDGGWCRMATVQHWRSAPLAFERKDLPAVFLWLAA
ncbi:MAG TPA: SAM-dependent methyltransferase [Burkholderiaceae bacterium]|nr:SAM-dependent methyltransferase [Burkholderiaceae bacterium]